MCELVSAHRKTTDSIELDSHSRNRIDHRFAGEAKLTPSRKRRLAIDEPIAQLTGGQREGLLRKGQSAIAHDRCHLVMNAHVSEKKEEGGGGWRSRKGFGTGPR